MQSGEGPLTLPEVILGVTVSVWNDDTGLLQPVLTVYVISVVPTRSAVTTPLEAFTMATAESTTPQINARSRHYHRQRKT